MTPSLFINQAEEDFIMQDMNLFGTVNEDEQYQKDLEMVKQDGLALACVKKQTPELCMAAVQQNG